MVTLPTLLLGRLRTIALETFKCINNIVPVYIRDFVTVRLTNFSFRFENTQQVPTVRTKMYGQLSFQFEAARLGNSLPNEMRKVSEYKVFKRLVRNWTGPKLRLRHMLWFIRFVLLIGGIVTECF